MVRTKALLIAVVLVLAACSTGTWLLVSEKLAAQERRKEFFGTNNEFPISGGQKMRPEW